MRTAIVLLIVLSLANLALSELATSGYVRRFESSTTGGCADTTRIRVYNFLVNQCNPSFAVIATYDVASSTVSLTYYSDAACTQVQTGPEYHSTGACEVGDLVATQYAYTQTLTSESGLYSRAWYNTSGSACATDLAFFEQYYTTCFANVYGSYQSQQRTCSGTAGTTKDCYDTNCQNCDVSSQTLDNSCLDKARNVCGAPAGSTPSSTTSSSPSSAPSSTSISTTPDNSGSSTGVSTPETTATSDAASVLLASSVLVAAILATLL